jgi:HEAT repeat protein
VLLTDSNPGVRTQAVDLLTQSREPSLAAVLQELLTHEENNYVRLKCQKALNEMNASVETF